MGITRNELVLGKTAIEGGKKPFVVDAYSADVTGNETLKVAAVGKDNYLTSIDIQCPSMSSGETIQINDDDTIMLGPLLADSVGGLLWSHYFDTPLKFSGAIKIDSQNVDPVHVTLEGFEA